MAIARGLLEQARARGVSLVGLEGLLAGMTRTGLQGALDAEMTDHLGYEKEMTDHLGYEKGPATCTCGPESPERDLRQDRGDPRSARSRWKSLPRSQRRIPASDHPEARPPGRGVQRGHRVAMPRAHHRGDPHAPGRDLRSRRLPGPDQQVTDRVTEELAAWQSRRWTVSGASGARRSSGSGDQPGSSSRRSWCSRQKSGGHLHDQRE